MTTSSAARQLALETIWVADPDVDLISKLPAVCRVFKVYSFHDLVVMGVTVETVRAAAQLHGFDDISGLAEAAGREAFDPDMPDVVNMARLLSMVAQDNDTPRDCWARSAQIATDMLRLEPLGLCYPCLAQLVLRDVSLEELERNMDAAIPNVHTAIVGQKITKSLIRKAKEALGYPDYGLYLLQDFVSDVGDGLVALLETWFPLLPAAASDIAVVRDRVMRCVGVGERAALLALWTLTDSWTGCSAGNDGVAVPLRKFPIGRDVLSVWPGSLESLGLVAERRCCGVVLVPGPGVNEMEDMVLYPGPH